MSGFQLQRLGLVMEPESGNPQEVEGVLYIEPLQRYVMTYTAYSPRGPRIALAISDDLFHWERMGLAIFMPYDGVDFNDVDNKDGLLFPEVITDPAGRPVMAIIHRPPFYGGHRRTCRDRASRYLPRLRSSGYHLGRIGQCGQRSADQPLEQPVSC